MLILHDLAVLGKELLSAMVCEETMLEHELRVKDRCRC